MALAVSLLFDSETDRAVRRVWQALADAGVCRSMADLDYPPHMSLIVTDDAMAQDSLKAALADLKGSGEFVLRLGPARHFPDTTISWLACEQTERLTRLQRQVADRPGHHSIREHYRPGQWTPHVTLQMTGDIKAALAIAAKVLPQMLEARVVDIDLARFLPVERVQSVALAY